MGYHPVGEAVSRGSNGKIVLAAAPAYVQTYSTAHRSVNNATVAAVTDTIAAVAPAGGTGATAGGWDTSGNRNTAITTATELRTLALSLKTQQNALRVDVAALFAATNALITDLREAGIVG